MQIDVFTLFPQWFDWFRGQRHVANALGLGSSLECIDYRAHTPLKAGQVDDTPFGGGAGMVLRVDVVEAALRARYGEDPVAVRERRRVIALTPGGRVLDDGVVEELAAEPELTLLCGRYEGFDERIVEHFCWPPWSSATRCCASSPARSATRTPRTRSRSAPRSTARRSTRTTHAPPTGAGGRFPRCC